jgi:GntR family transcriptional repressor for pyruvate dehydrogenase complex
MGVSRATLREAFRVLEHIGLVQSRPGRGWFIAEAKSVGVGVSVPSQAVEYDTILDFLQVRRFLEVPMAGVAAELANEEDIVRLETALYMPQESEEEWLRSHLEFHVVVAEATRNTVYKRFISSEEYLLYRVATTAMLSATRRPFSNEHQEVLEAIRRHDRVDAEAAMLNDISNVTRIVRSCRGQLYPPTTGTSNRPGIPSRRS